MRNYLWKVAHAQTVPQIADRTFVDTWLSGLHVATDSRPDICGTGPQSVTHAQTSVESCSFVQYQLRSKAVYSKVFKMSFQCQECDQSFPYKRNLTRHIKTVHGNEPRKDNEARKEGLLAGLYSETFEAQVESVPRQCSKVKVKY